MTFANNLDPDEAPQNVGLHLRSKLFDIQIIYQQNILGGNIDFLHLFKEKNIWKNYPACKELTEWARKIGLWCIRDSEMFAYIAAGNMDFLKCVEMNYYGAISLGLIPWLCRSCSLCRISPVAGSTGHGQTVSALAAWWCNNRPVSYARSQQTSCGRGTHCLQQQ